MRSAVLSVFGALLMVTGFPPFGWSPVTWLGVAVLIWAWQTAPTGRAAIVSGYLAGLAFFAALFWWLNNVELLAYVPLVIVQSVFMVWTAWATWRLRAAVPWVWVAGVSGAWALAEVARVRAPFGGFPWGVVGLTADNTPLRGAAQWIGATGWSVLIVALAASAVLVLERRERLRDLVAGLVVVTGLAALGVAFPATADGEALTLALVQGNSPCPGSRCPNERLIIFDNHLTLTREIAEADGVDLVVWPESSTGFSSDPLAHPEIAELIAGEARRLGGFFLVGGDRSDGPDRFVNSNVLFDPTGAIVGEYRKTHPVPFGEYVPFRPVFEWIPALDQVPRDMVRGDGPVTFDVAGVPVGSVISYEGAFARYPRDAVRDGAGVVVVATNTSSYGESPAADQFIAMSRMRAAELGTDIVHAAVTGKSAILRADGTVVGPTGLFTGEVLIDTVRTRDAGPTVYARLGDWLQSIAAVVGLAALVHVRRSAPTPRTT